MSCPWQIEYEGAFLLVMAGRSVYKSTDRRIIWFNPFISKPAGSNHQKENGVRAEFIKPDRSH